jgi:arginase
MFELPIAPGRFAVLRAPSGLGLRAAGVEGLGDALLGQGLARALDARIAAFVAPPAASGIRDPERGVLNAREVAGYGVVLSDAVGLRLDQ